MRSLDGPGGKSDHGCPLPRSDAPRLDAILTKLLQEDGGAKGEAFVASLLRDATNPKTRGRAQLATMVWDRMLGPVAQKIESETLNELVKRSIQVKGTDVGKRAAMPGEEEGEDG